MENGKTLPQRKLVYVYAAYSLIGTILLLLPFSSVGDIRIVDHLFTVVSALSTTGLSTVDVSSQYTFFGQLVILTLIQMGGLGYMTLTSYIMLKMTGHFLKRDAEMVLTQFSFPQSIDFRSLLKSIIHYTFLLEAAGFLLLAPYFLIRGAEQPVWSALFHSVSAFCTAGFSIYSDNLVRFQTDVYVNVVIMALAVLGAMGFIMMTDLARKFTRRRYKVSFTTKVILTITGAQACWGMLHLFFFETTLKGFPPLQRLMVSLFQSVSAMTTVGYNTVDIDGMVPISMLVLTIIMYVGASPSGTGGGLKSTTLSAIYAYTKNKLMMRKKTTLQGHIIPHYRLETAMTTAFFYSFILFLGVYLISLFEPADADFLDILFEASSALATAGLTSGILSEITIGSKIVLILLMFIGRVGVITFGNAVLIRSHREEKEDPVDMAV